MFIFAASLRNFMIDIKTPQDHIILVPMDFSDSSINAVYYAVEMANFFDSEVTLLHVISKSMLSNLLRAGTRYSDGHGCHFGTSGTVRPQAPSALRLHRRTTT